MAVDLGVLGISRLGGLIIRPFRVLIWVRRVSDSSCSITLENSLTVLSIASSLDFRTHKTLYHFQAQQISDDLVNNPPQVVVQQATPTSSTQVRVSEQRSPQISPQKSSSSIKWQSPSNSTNAAAHRPWVGSTLEPKKFKPIKVDNWGIFLLSRLQTYFQKKEYTDLTLRFPSKNAQIKVHKLVVNACTDYFIKAADLGLIQDGIYDMPPTLLPEYVAPIIRFMYTGRLDLKSHMFEKMKATSTTLGMSVLTKLLDAQINAPPEVLANAQQQKKPRRMDPVRQIKQIKKIGNVQFDFFS